MLVFDGQGEILVYTTQNRGLRSIVVVLQIVALTTRDRSPARTFLFAIFADASSDFPFFFALFFLQNSYIELASLLL